MCIRDRRTASDPTVPPPSYVGSAFRRTYTCVQYRPYEVHALRVGDLDGHRAGGGVSKTTDGGIRWTPVPDSMPVAAIGALAVAPSDPNVVWAGTGEAWAIRDSDVIGDGISKSMHAGRTWTHMGLDETGRIGRIVVNPTNPDIVLACAIGRI